MTARHPAAVKYRVNRVGDPVVDKPRTTRKSSAAREAYKAARFARRHPAAVATQRIAAAFVPPSARTRTGDDVVAELLADARDALVELLGPLPQPGPANTATQETTP